MSAAERAPGDPDLPTGLPDEGDEDVPLGVPPDEEDAERELPGFPEGDTDTAG